MENNTHPCNLGHNHAHNNLEHVIKLWVDECTGKFIYPITVTDAVITKHGKLLTEVLELIFLKLDLELSGLNQLSIRIEDLEKYRDLFIELKRAFDFLKLQFDSGLFVTKCDLLEWEEEIRTLVESLSARLAANTDLFRQLLSVLMAGEVGGSSSDISSLLETLLNDYVLKSGLLTEIRALNSFVEKIKSDFTNATYEPSNGLITLPPTIGSSLYVGGFNDTEHRFYRYVLGDVNGDGQVTAADITALYNWLLISQDDTSGDLPEIINGDLTGDNHITAADVTAVYNVLLSDLTYTSIQILDRRTHKVYDLPEGTIYVTGDNLLLVKKNNDGFYIESVGRLIDPNSQFYLPHYDSGESSPNLAPTVVGIPHVEPQIPDIAEPVSIDYEITEADRLTVVDKIGKRFGEKLYNVYLIAALISNNLQETLENVTAIEEALENNTFQISSTNFGMPAVNELWTGYPLDYAQGIAFMKSNWGLTNEIQYILPLGSFIDFRRFLSNKLTNFIDILLYGEEHYNPALTRFTLVLVTQSLDLRFAGNEDYTILAEYVPESGTAYYFFWDGRSKRKPVVIEKSKLSTYLNSINYQ